MITETIKIQVSSALAEQLRPYYQQLPQILEWGLRYLEKKQTEQDTVNRVLLSTGFIRHLDATDINEPDAPRQLPPVLPGTPTSEILMAQRRGDA